MALLRQAAEQFHCGDDPYTTPQAIAAGAAERVLFGSDGPGCNPRLKVEKVRMLGLGRDAEGLILSGNAVRLLRLEEVAT